MNSILAITVVGVLAVAAYLIVSATSNTASSCSGDWTDYINPACIFSGILSNAENEVNTIVILVVLAAVAIVALLAFGSSTGSIASALAPGFKL